MSPVSNRILAGCNLAVTWCSVRIIMIYDVVLFLIKTFKKYVWVFTHKFDDQLDLSFR